MGGFGSGRQGGTVTAEGTASYVIAISSVKAALRTGQCLTGTIPFDEGKFPVQITVDASNPESAFVELYHGTRDEREGARMVRDRVPLTWTAPPYGGRRWWFLCPRTGRRATKLFLPNGGQHFWSRAGYGLGYACQREGSFDRLQRRADAAIEFAMARIQADHPGRSGMVGRQAVELLLERLRSQTETDGDRFAGYAPVLQAVATRVAKDSNPGALVAQIKGGTQPITLQEVGASILERERTKLEPLAFEGAGIKERLYLPQEQLDRLVAVIYGLKPPELPTMSPKDAQTYSNALKSWVAEHPFLDGGHGTSSAVFEAMITIHAVKGPAAEPALHRELGRGASANPFLSEFYLPGENISEPIYLSPGHVGIVYSSLRARLSLGDTASLVIDAPEDAVEEEALQAVVEITLARRNEFERQRILRFETEQVGTLYLGAYVEDVELSLPHMRVDVGPGPGAVFVAPISIQCQQLVLRAEKVIVEPPAGSNGEAVYLEAETFQGDQMMSAPVVRGDVVFKVSWPGANAFPWSAYSTEPTPIEDPRVDEALRRFRKFLTAFRSHSRGNLGRLQDKIESERMTKGTGRAVLNRMIEDRILTLKGRQYILDPDRLGAQTDAVYTDVVARRFTSKTIEFVKKALAGTA
jgi:hypothetical protein